MTTPTISANTGFIAAGGNVGKVNSENFIIKTLNVYYWDPGERRKQLAKWVSDLDFSPYQSQAFERYTEGTLLWVLDEAEFKAWLTDGGMLWCPGKPGAGKTVFASFVIHHLQNHPDAIVCYIYHRYDTTPSTLQLFEAILNQLILRCPSMNIDRVEAGKNQGQRLTLKEILSILQETFTHVPNIFVVLDAFDECFDEHTRHQVFHHLQSLHSVNTLITSRYLPSIERAVGTARRLIISAHGKDIRTHFQVHTKINRRLSKLVAKGSVTDIEGRLVEKADGRFLLAGLHITNLAVQTNVSQFRHALETLPQEVTASYEETLSQIRRQDPTVRQLAFHTLSWIYYALRPLSMTELRHALTIHNLNRMAKADDLTDEETIISSCLGLVVVNRSLDRSVSVNFLHYTVQEFLQQARRDADFLSEVDITLQCMKVISFPGIMSKPPNYPLIRYAASVWGPLVRRHEQDKTVFELACAQLSDSVTIGVLSDARIDYDLQSYSGDYRGQSGATAIHLTAVYGLLSVMKVFMALTSTTINEQDRDGCTALIWAVRNGHLEIVKEFLGQPNVDVNSRDGRYGRTPLAWAEEKGHLEVFKELQNIQHASNFQYSKCAGRKKALCVGVNYFGQPHELRGCINDARHMRDFLIRHFGYRAEDIVLLTDDDPNPKCQPTKKNMLDAMRWLVDGAQANDSFVFHYSGHGGQTPDDDGDKIDGYDEVIYPLDFKKRGHIVDDEMHTIMVKPLPPGCRLTAIFDCSHSGTALDLPYIYSSRGRLKDSHISRKAVAQKATPADVMSWSGSKDGKKMEIFCAGVAVGTMSYAFIQAIKQNPNQSYQQLLASIRTILYPKYGQKPELGSSHHIDTNLLFVM